MLFTIAVGSYAYFKTDLRVNGYANVKIELLFDMLDETARTEYQEGVESEDVARELIKLGCVQAQGYLYQKPMPFSAWDKSGKLVKE